LHRDHTESEFFILLLTGRIFLIFPASGWTARIQDLKKKQKTPTSGEETLFFSSGTWHTYFSFRKKYQLPSILNDFVS